VLAPGQGAQKPGFLTPWLDLDGVAAQLRWYSACSSLDLVHLGTEAGAEEIRDTASTQPLLVAAGLVAGSRLSLHDVAVVAGHSIGELTAAALAGVLSAESAVTLAGIRGREMAAACALADTGMSALLGGDPEEVVGRVEACGLTPANRNGAGQVVAAGAREGLDALAADPPARTRVVPLQVAGAFHTAYMAPAERALAEVAGAIPTDDPARLLLSNADGTALTTGAEALRRLVRQVTSPVRWDLCQDALADLGVTAVLELPPAGTLAGLARRALKGVEILTLSTPDDLAAARDLVSRHGSHSGAEPSVSFHVTVAPAAGAFRQGGHAEGDTVGAGTALGEVVTRQGPVPVATAHRGVLVEWLASEGDPVASGQPVARLHPVEVPS